MYICSTENLESRENGMFEIMLGQQEVPAQRGQNSRELIRLCFNLCKMGTSKEGSGLRFKDKGRTVTLA